MVKSSGPILEEIDFLRWGLPALSSTAREFVRHCPREARMAVAVALETAAAQREAENLSVLVEVPEQLRPFVVERSTEGMLGVAEAAERLEVSRTTVYDWAAKNTLLAWRSTKRRLSIPAAQILGPGRVVPGLAGIVNIVGDPELAWEFLAQEWPFKDEAAMPLDLLKAGRVDEVLDAAPGFGNTFT